MSSPEMYDANALHEAMSVSQIFFEERRIFTLPIIILIIALPLCFPDNFTCPFILQGLGTNESVLVEILCTRSFEVIVAVYFLINFNHVFVFTPKERTHATLGVLELIDIYLFIYVMVSLGTRDSDVIFRYRKSKPLDAPTKRVNILIARPSLVLLC